MATLQGRIVETYTGRGVSGVLVSMGGATAITDANGGFTIQAPPGNWTLQAVHRDFQAYSQPMRLPQNMAYTLQAPIRIRSVVRPL